MAPFDMMSEELKWYFWEGFLKLVHLYWIKHVKSVLQELIILS